MQWQNLLLTKAVAKYFFRKKVISKNTFLLFYFFTFLLFYFFTKSIIRYIL